MATYTEFMDRIQELEQKVSDLYEALGRPEPNPRPSGSVSAEVQQLVAQGKTLEAIKMHRQQTGADMDEAKAAIASITGTQG
jgi:ribosomal protein L7/L12